MKKVVSVILTLVVVSLLTSYVNATTAFATTLKSNKDSIKAGEKVEVVLSLSDFTSGEKGINVLVAELDYDTSLFEEIYAQDIKPIEVWGDVTYNPVNHKLVTDSNSFTTSNHEAIKVELTAREDIDSTTMTRVGFKDIVASDSESDISAPDAYTTINLQKSVKAESSSNKKLDVKLIVALVIVAILAVVVIEFANKKIRNDKKK